MTWEEDRKKLREALRLGMQNKTLHGLEGTFLCALVAHMRGKLHMKSYGAKRGGWRAGWHSSGTTTCASVVRNENDLPPVFRKRYGDAAWLYYGWSIIETLDDQAEWIRKFRREVDFESLQLLAEVVERILTKSWDAPIAQQSAERSA